MTSWLELVLTAAATGFGTAIGNYLAIRGLLKRIEKALKRRNDKRR